MSRYKLRANYDIENIDSQKMDGTEDRIKAAGEEVKNYSVFQDWMNDMDLKNKITDK